MKSAAIVAGLAVFACLALTACSSDPDQRERQINAVRAFGQALSGASAGMNAANAAQESAPAIQPSSSLAGVVCMKSSESHSMMSKICFYNCVGTAYATNVGSADLCPLSVSHP